MTHKITSVCIHASELAACIGKNPYKSRLEAMNDYVRRLGGEEMAAKLPPSKRQRLDEVMSALKIAAPSVHADVVEGKLECADDVHKCIAGAVDALKVNKALKGKGALVEAQDLVRGAVFGRFGTEQEDTVRGGLGERTVKTDKYVKKKLTTVDGVVVYIGGKCDGLSEDGKRVVEIKNRVRRLLSKVVEYERIQVLAYLFIHGLEFADLVEKFGEKTRKYEIQFDEDEWRDVVEEVVQFVEDLMLRFSGDE